MWLEMFFSVVIVNMCPIKKKIEKKIGKRSFAVILALIIQ